MTVVASAALIAVGLAWLVLVQQRDLLAQPPPAR
jgi:hypothetical protein